MMMIISFYCVVLCLELSEINMTKLIQSSAATSRASSSAVVI